MRQPLIPTIALAMATATACPAQTAPAAAPAPTPAAAPAPASPATVVVTGRRLPSRAAVEHLTHAITRTGDASEPMARFPDAVCPSSQGMPLDYDDRLAARLRADAVAAGIRVDPPGCRPNVIVLIVSSGQAVVRALRRTRGWMFGGLEPAAVDAMAADAGPVHGWSVTRRRSRDADTLRQGTMLQDVPEIQVRDTSIIDSATRLDVDGAVLLLDVDAVIGKTVNQLAGYAAMRLLAPTRPTGEGGKRGAGADAGDTILSLFAPGDPAGRPRGLTGFDAAYLKAVYQGPATERAQAKAGRMARAIAAGSPAAGAR